MARVNHGQITVTSTAQQLTSDHTIATSTLLVKAFPSNTVTVFLGKAGVATSTGYPIAPGEEFRVVFTDRPGETMDIKPADYYVIGASGTVAWIAQR